MGSAMPGMLPARRFRSCLFRISKKGLKQQRAILEQPLFRLADKTMLIELRMQSMLFNKDLPIGLARMDLSLPKRDLLRKSGTQEHTILMRLQAVKMSVLIRQRVMDLALRTFRLAM